MILVDTNVLYALGDTDDEAHFRARRWIEQCEDTALLVLTTVVAETCYLLDHRLGPHAEAAFLDELGIGAEYRFQLVDLVDADIRRMGQLVRRYADRRLGGTDASVVAVAERLGITTIATVNRRDFDNVRPQHARAFTIVPE